MSSTLSKGQVARWNQMANEARSLRDLSGLSFEMIARQLKLCERANAQKFYRRAVVNLLRTHWFKLPMPVRERWWQETDYGKYDPSMPFVQDLSKALRTAGVKD